MDRQMGWEDEVWPDYKLDPPKDSTESPEGTGPVPVCRAFDEPAAGLHLHIQASLHAAHLHVLMQVAVHVTFGCGQLQLGGTNQEYE